MQASKEHPLLASSNAKSAPTLIVASSLGAFFACIATLAVVIACSLSAAKEGRFAHRAPEDAWPTQPRTWWIACCPKRLCDSGS
jgi:hypothetical protein